MGPNSHFLLYEWAPLKLPKNQVSEFSDANWRRAKYRQSNKSSEN